MHMYTLFTGSIEWQYIHVMHRLYRFTMFFWPNQRPRGVFWGPKDARCFLGDFQGEGRESWEIFRQVSQTAESKRGNFWDVPFEGAEWMVRGGEKHHFSKVQTALFGRCWYITYWLANEITKQRRDIVGSSAPPLLVVSDIWRKRKCFNFPRWPCQLTTVCNSHAPPETNIAPEIWCLEDDPFLLGMA